MKVEGDAEDAGRKKLMAIVPRGGRDVGRAVGVERRSSKRYSAAIWSGGLNAVARYSIKAARVLAVACVLAVASPLLIKYARPLEGYAIEAGAST